MSPAMIALGLVLASAGVASAFPTGEQFDLDPLVDDGAGGIAFDGAPRFAGHTCDVCHTGAARTIALRLESDHPELFTTGWKPNQQYHLRVVMQNEHAGLELKAFGDNCGFFADGPDAERAGAVARWKAVVASRADLDL